MAFQAFESRSSLYENETPRIERSPRYDDYPINLYLSVSVDPYEAEKNSDALIEQGTAESLVEWTSHSDYHMSLSRSIEIPRGQVYSVLNALRKELYHFEEMPVSISNSFKGFFNSCGTRAFLAALVSKDDKENVVVPVIRAINRALASHGLPEYCTDAQPHMSVASTYDTDDTDEIDILPSFESPLQCIPKKEITINFSHLVCKVGEFQHTFWLKENSGWNSKVNQRYAAMEYTDSERSFPKHRN